MNVYFALVAQPLAQVIGGMETIIWDLQFFYRPTDGLMIVETRTKRNDCRKLQMN